MSEMMMWDDLRLAQVEEAAQGCPDACSADVVSLIAEVRRLRSAPSEAARYRAALQRIRDQFGKVCDLAELCHHTACDSSAGAWFEADAALAHDDASGEERG